MDAVRAFNERVTAMGQSGAVGTGPIHQEVERLNALSHAAANLGLAGQEQGCEVVLAQARALASTIERPLVLDTAKINNLRLIDQSGELIGEVDDLIIDPASGRIAYAVIKTGGVLGLGERRIPLPWSLLTLSARRDGMIVNIPRDRLISGPQLGQGERPDMSSRQWAMALHTYYDAVPYWLADQATTPFAATAGASGTSVAESDGRAGGSAADDPLNNILRDSPAK